MRIRDLITKQTILEITATQPGVVVYNFSGPTNKDVTIDKIIHNAEMIRQGKAKLDWYDHLNQFVNDTANGVTFDLADAAAAYVNSWANGTPYADEYKKFATASKEYAKLPGALSTHVSIPKSVPIIGGEHDPSLGDVAGSVFGYGGAAVKGAYLGGKTAMKVARKTLGGNTGRTIARKGGAVVGGTAGLLGSAAPGAFLDPDTYGDDEPAQQTKESTMKRINENQLINSADRLRSLLEQEIPAPSAYKGSTGSQEVQKLNPDKIKDVNKIYPGQQFKMADGQTITVKPGDTLDKLSAAHPAPTATTSDMGQEVNQLKTAAASSTPVKTNGPQNITSQGPEVKATDPVASSPVKKVSATMDEDGNIIVTKLDGTLIIIGPDDKIIPQGQGREGEVAPGQLQPLDYQTKEPLKKGADGKWYNSKGEERDSLHGGPVNTDGTAQFRSLTPKQENFQKSVSGNHLNVSDPKIKAMQARADQDPNGVNYRTSVQEEHALARIIQLSRG